ncbi:MAG: DNA replication and repair protein RecF, partial [Candidatus Promineifilaceae bacterium]
MFIRHLSLTGFRNYGRLELDLLPGTTILYGDNAQGKTNLLEAVYYLATTRSPYSDSDQQIINWDINLPEEPIVVARLVATIQYEANNQQTSKNGTDTDNQKTIELRLIRENRNGSTVFRREAVIDRRKVRLMDLLGQLKVVLFLPSDLELITGNPSARRRYIDITLCQTDSVYCRTLSGYNKLLEQRNAALKSFAESGRGKDVINILSERLAQTAAEIFARRAAFMHHLAEEVSRTHYEELTGRTETVKLSYLPRLTVTGSGRGTQDHSAELLKLADWLLENVEDQNLIAKRYLEVLHLSFEKDVGSG